jgi:hypothetical protein
LPFSKLNKTIMVTTTTENIKARVSFFWKGRDKAFKTVQDYNVIRELLSDNTTDTHPQEIPVRFLTLDGKNHQVDHIEISVRKETEDLHLKYGMSIIREGNRSRTILM